eukprot:TRINITY_DN1396_c0_g1_i1.p1 TRINITY_DN1396_c0_g1~~TRINITY_DN1396_c0_g1_i1.p1  ORF type:complete len:409 (-),score=81.32 TRINITY_DN1396_c0_g1_i1:830-2056(-)
MGDMDNDDDPVLVRALEDQLLLRRERSRLLETYGTLKLLHAEKKHALFRIAVEVREHRSRMIAEFENGTTRDTALSSFCEGPPSPKHEPLQVQLRVDGRASAAKRRRTDRADAVTTVPGFVPEPLKMWKPKGVTITAFLVSQLMQTKTVVAATADGELTQWILGRVTDFDELQQICMVERSDGDLVECNFGNLGQFPTSEQSHVYKDDENVLVQRYDDVMQQWQDVLDPASVVNSKASSTSITVRLKANGITVDVDCCHVMKMPRKQRGPTAAASVKALKAVKSAKPKSGVKSGTGKSAAKKRKIVSKRKQLPAEAALVSGGSVAQRPHLSAHSSAQQNDNGIDNGIDNEGELVVDEASPSLEDADGFAVLAMDNLHSDAEDGVATINSFHYSPTPTTTAALDDSVEL